MVTHSPRTRRGPRWSVLAHPKSREQAPVRQRRWSWIMLDEAGIVRPRRPTCFTSQDGAEHWLNANAASLTVDGVTAVVLHDGECVVYGPIPLAP